MLKTRSHAALVGSLHFGNEGYVMLLHGFNQPSKNSLVLGCGCHACVGQFDIRRFKPALFQRQLKTDNFSICVYRHKRDPIKIGFFNLLPHSFNVRGRT